MAPKISEAPSTKELVRRIVGGDTAADEELVRTFRRGLSYMLLRLVNDPAASEDILQETLRISLIKIRQGELREPEKLPGFLRGIARNLVIAEQRKYARRPQPRELEDIAEPTDPGPDPLQQALCKEDRRRVRELLKELGSSRDRELLLRFHLSEEPKEQICADMDLTGQQFNVAIFRARKRFRQLIESGIGAGK